MKSRTNTDRATLLALIFGIAKTGVPLRIKGVPCNSPIVEAIKLAYEGLGMVVLTPSHDTSTVTIAAYPTSVRGVSALAAEVFRNGFKNIRSRSRLNLAA